MEKEEQDDTKEENLTILKATDILTRCILPRGKVLPAVLYRFAEQISCHECYLLYLRPSLPAVLYGHLSQK